MDWKTLPGYDEKYANISIKERKSFGGKVIDVLYGAKDENGNAAVPVAGKDDGHGEWFGIENEKGYVMFTLKHPASEGGEVEYGTSHGDHALEDMEADLAKKQALCKEINDLQPSEENAARVDELKQAYAGVEDWGTAKDAEYNEWFNRKADEFEKNKNVIAENTKAKQELVDEAAKLADAQEWKAGQAKLRELEDKWDELGSAGAADSALHTAFRDARRKFFAAKDEYFDNLDKMRAENKAKKEELVAKAQDAVKDIKSYKATGDLMNSLMDSWKAVKSAGHETDEALWKEFSAARQEFFTKRRAFYEERDAQRKESIDAKRALIEKAKEIAARNDYSRETTDEMKQLDVEWKKLGYSGKDENDRLWDEFKVAKDVFWNGKHDASQARFKSLIDRKDEQIRNMREQVNRLEERVYETDDFEEEQDLNRRAAQKKNIIENMKKDIEDLKSKLDD